MRLTDTLLLIQIPATAGQAFGEALAAHLGPAACAVDHGPDSDDAHPLVLSHVHEAGDLLGFSQAAQAQGLKLLAGQAAARYAPLVPLGQVLSFVRQPLAQAGAHYRHQVQAQGYRGTEAAYLAGPLGAGCQARQLDLAPVEALGFVGVSERPAESLAMFKAAYGLDLHLPAPVGPAERSTRPVFSDAGAAHFRAMAGADYQLYRRAHAALDARLAMHRAGMPYVHGAIQSHGPHRLQGFAFWQGNEDAVEVEVLVNGLRRARTRATLERPCLRASNAPRLGYVGFEFHAGHALWAADDEVTVRVAGTGQMLGRSWQRAALVADRAPQRMATA
jgi:hypothetical protein